MRVPSRMMSMIIELQGRYADKYTKGSMNACGWTNKANKSPITISVSYSACKRSITCHFRQVIPTAHNATRGVAPRSLLEHIAEYSAFEQSGVQKGARNLG